MDIVLKLLGLAATVAGSAAAVYLMLAWIEASEQRRRDEARFRRQRMWGV